MELFYCDADADKDIPLYEGNCFAPERPEITKSCSKVSRFFRNKAFLKTILFLLWYSQRDDVLLVMSIYTFSIAYQSIFYKLCSGKVSVGYGCATVYLSRGSWITSRRT